VLSSNFLNGTHYIRSLFQDYETIDSTKFTKPSLYHFLSNLEGNTFRIESAQPARPRSFVLLHSRYSLSKFNRSSSVPRISRYRAGGLIQQPQFAHATPSWGVFSGFGSVQLHGFIRNSTLMLGLLVPYAC